MIDSLSSRSWPPELDLADEGAVQLVARLDASPTEALISAAPWFLLSNFAQVARVKGAACYMISWAPQDETGSDMPACIPIIVASTTIEAGTIIDLVGGRLSTRLTAAPT